MNNLPILMNNQFQTDPARLGYNEQFTDSNERSMPERSRCIKLLGWAIMNNLLIPMSDRCQKDPGVSSC